MKFDGWNLRSLWRVLGACLLSAPVLAACAKPTPPVSVHGVNYSDDTFSYVVVDPNNAKNTAGGELIEPYAAGGTTCCYELPKKWQPGMKMSIRSTHWLGKAADGSLRDVVGTHLVEVPRYPDGKPGELWVLRAVDGSMSVVSSDFQPDHPNWAGKIKGWPVPSLAYQRERWNLYINHQKDFLTTFEALLDLLNKSPDKAAQEAWNTSFEYNKKSIAEYTGPQDTKYRKMLKEHYQTAIEEIRAEIDRLQRGRP